MIEENRIKFEAHLRAIEDAVTNAELEGGCDFAEYVRYHVEEVRGQLSQLINQN